MGRIAWALGLGVLALIGVMGFNTVNYGGPPTPPTLTPTLPERFRVDARETAQALAAAIRLQTIVEPNGAVRDPAPFAALRQWARDIAPNLAASANYEIIANHALMVTWPGADPALKPLVLMAHMDVVPVNPGTEGDWTRAPFDGAVDDDVVIGRGALDDKGAMTAILKAADALAASGFAPKRTIILAFGHDEEVLGIGAASIAYVTSLRFGKAHMVVDEGFMTLDPFPATGKRATIVGVAEKGVLNIRLTASGEGGHSSIPPRRTAVEALAEGIDALTKSRLDPDPMASPVKEMFQSLSADLPMTTKFALANAWALKPVVAASLAGDPRTDAVQRTTIAPTLLEGSSAVNVLAQRASAVVNFRLHPKDAPDEVLAKVRRALAGAPGVSAEIEGEPFAASAISPMSGPLWEQIKAVAYAVGDGAPVAPGLVLGATDARQWDGKADAVYRFMPAILKPEDLGGFHGTNETISIENLERMTRGYAQMMTLIAETADPQLLAQKPPRPDGMMIALDERTTGGIYALPIGARFSVTLPLGENTDYVWRQSEGLRGEFKLLSEEMVEVAGPDGAARKYWRQIYEMTARTAMEMRFRETRADGQYNPETEIVLIISAQ